MLSQTVKKQISDARITIFIASLAVLSYSGIPQMPIWGRNLAIVVSGVFLLLTFVKGNEEEQSPCPYGYTYTDLLNQLVFIAIWVLVGMIVHCPQVLGISL